MAGVFINSSQSIYATDADIQNDLDNLNTQIQLLGTEVSILTTQQIAIQNEVTQLQANTQVLRTQYFKSASPQVNNTINPGVPTLMIGYDAIDPVSGVFAQLTPGTLQYTGTVSGTFYVSFSISGLPTDPANNDKFISFYLAKNGGLEGGSVQIEYFLVNRYHSVMGDCNVILNPLDILQVFATLDSSGTFGNFSVQNISILAFRL
jgi:hypothetical protein